MIEYLNHKKSTLYKFLKAYWVHFLSWAIFIFWETIMVGFFTGYYGSLANYIIHYTIHICFFYFNSNQLMSLGKVRSSAYWKIPLLIFSEITIYTLATMFIDELLRSYTSILPATPAPLQQTLFRILYRCSFFLLFSTGYYFIKRFINERVERTRVEGERFRILLEKEKKERELLEVYNAYLRAQINPHLLYSTLDFIYNRLSIYSPNDAKIILILTEMMRFAGDPDKSGKSIRLADEIRQCENLIKLHKLTRGRINIEFASAQDTEHLFLIPLVLLTLLENMFKHGELSDNQKKATLDVYCVDGKLRIHSLNRPRNNQNESGFGSGLENIQKRLLFAYGRNAHMQNFLDKAGFYHCIIEISISQLGNTLQTNSGRDKNIDIGQTVAKDGWNGSASRLT